MEGSLPHFPVFDIDSEPSSTGQRWNKYLSRFQNYPIAFGIKDDERKKALLLHYGGVPLQKVFETFTDYDKLKFNETVKALTEYFQPKKNTSFEVFNFRKATQKAGETIDQFCSRLKKLSIHFEFNDANREVKSQIQLGTKQSSLRRYAFRKPELTLDELLLHGRTLELSESQAKQLKKIYQLPTQDHKLRT